MGPHTEDDLLPRVRTAAAHDLQNVQAERDDALSADEERFVTTFVEYWTRRGAQIVRIRA